MVGTRIAIKRRTMTEQRIKLLARVLISVVTLGIGSALVAWVPECRTLGSGMIGAVIGYWLE